MDKLFSTLCTAGNIVAQPVSLFAQNPYYYFCKGKRAQYDDCGRI